MFVDPKQINAGNPITALIAVAARRPAGHTRHDIGVYEIGHFSFDMMLSRGGGNLTKDDEWDEYADGIPGELNAYGVCDSIEQFLADYGEALADSKQEYCVTFTHIAKDPGSRGGWRWHKWGPYVGRGEPTTEYLADEEGFDCGVHVYHIYQRRVGGGK